jgi:hypothetical protein
MESYLTVSCNIEALTNAGLFPVERGEVVYLEVQP